VKCFENPAEGWRHSVWRVSVPDPGCILQVDDKALLSDAKRAEDQVEYVVGRGGAGDLIECS
jgi:hypothetical protein